MASIKFIYTLTLSMYIIINLVKEVIIGTNIVLINVHIKKK